MTQFRYALTKTGIQDLSSSSLTLTTDFANRFIPRAVLVHGDATIESETLKVTLDSEDGSNYDGVIYDSGALSAGTTDVYYKDFGNLVVRNGDQIKITLTNSTSTASVYVTIFAEQI